MKKLVLDRETLKVLSPADARRVQGGRKFSDLPGCSDGGSPCTHSCPPNTPPSYLISCTCPPPY